MNHVLYLHELPFISDLPSFQDARGAEAGQRGRRVGRQDGEGEEGDAGKHDIMLIKSEWHIINPLPSLKSLRSATTL